MIRQYLPYLIACMIVLSCSNDADNTPVAPNGKLTANVNGTLLESTAFAELHNDAIFIVTVGFPAITLQIENGLKPGTYYFTSATQGTTPNALLTYIDSSGQEYNSQSGSPTHEAGSITISGVDEVNKTISGSFNSKTSVVHSTSANPETLHIRDGSFTNIPYRDDPYKRTLTAQVDGKPFVAQRVTAAKAPERIIITATATDNVHIMRISIPAKATAAAYTLSDLLTGPYAQYNAGGEPYVSMNGLLTLNTHDIAGKSMEGTFSFTARPMFTNGSNRIVTKGQFYIEYR